jgi:hypothetical protein
MFQGSCECSQVPARVQTVLHSSSEVCRNRCRSHCLKTSTSSARASWRRSTRRRTKRTNQGARVSINTITKVASLEGVGDALRCCLIAPYAESLPKSSLLLRQTSTRIGFFQMVWHGYRGYVTSFLGEILTINTSFLSKHGFLAS